MYMPSTRGLQKKRIEAWLTKVHAGPAVRDRWNIVRKVTKIMAWVTDVIVNHITGLRLTRQTHVLQF